MHAKSGYVLEFRGFQFSGGSANSGCSLDGIGQAIHDYGMVEWLNTGSTRGFFHAHNKILYVVSLFLLVDVSPYVKPAPGRLCGGLLACVQTCSLPCYLFRLPVCGFWYGFSLCVRYVLCVVLLLLPSLFARNYAARKVPKSWDSLRPLGLGPHALSR